LISSSLAKKTDLNLLQVEAIQPRFCLSVHPTKQRLRLKMGFRSENPNRRKKENQMDKQHSYCGAPNTEHERGAGKRRKQEYPNQITFLGGEGKLIGECFR
jgi:hypothetical protein